MNRDVEVFVAGVMGAALMTVLGSCAMFVDSYLRPTEITFETVEDAYVYDVLTEEIGDPPTEMPPFKVYDAPQD